MTVVLYVRGTMESAPTATAAHLRAVSGLEVVEVAYPAVYGVPMSYSDSRRLGALALRRAIDTTDEPVILAGYSQGAVIAGDVAADMARGGDTRLVGAVLIGDPLRPPGVGVCGDPGGWGIAGRRTVEHPRVAWAAAPGDVITACPRESLLRLVADTTGLMGPDLDAWARDLRRRVLTAGWQLAGVPLLDILRGVGPALWDLDGYLRRGRHTSYTTELYDDRTLIEWAVADVLETKERDQR